MKLFEIRITAKGFIGTEISTSVMAFLSKVNKFKQREFSQEGSRKKRCYAFMFLLRAFVLLNRAE